MNAEKFDQKESIPENNTLPLNIKESDLFVEGGESTVWRTLVEDRNHQDVRVALKQTRKTRFADDAEMQKSKKFYDLLKNSSDFGKFVPETLYFKAQMSSDASPQSYSLQRFIEGTPISAMDDEALYKNPIVVRQLMEFTRAALAMLESAKREKTQRLDLGKTPDADMRTTILANYILNPRYSSNVVIADQPSANGQYVFFVDTGENLEERGNRARKLYQRHVSTPVQQAHLRQWLKKLEEISTFQKNAAHHTVE